MVCKRHQISTQRRFILIVITPYSQSNRSRGNSETKSFLTTSSVRATVCTDISFHTKQIIYIKMKYSTTWCATTTTACHDRSINWIIRQRWSQLISSTTTISSMATTRMLTKTTCIRRSSSGSVTKSSGTYFTWNKFFVSAGKLSHCLT